MVTIDRVLDATTAVLESTAKMGGPADLGSRSRNEGPGWPYKRRSPTDPGLGYPQNWHSAAIAVPLSAVLVTGDEIHPGVTTVELELFVTSAVERGASRRRATSVLPEEAAPKRPGVAHARASAGAFKGSPLGRTGPFRRPALESLRKDFQSTGRAPKAGPGPLAPREAPQGPHAARR